MASLRQVASQGISVAEMLLHMSQEGQLSDVPQRLQRAAQQLQEDATAVLARSHSNKSNVSTPSRRRVYEELIETERTFIDEMRVVLDVFIEPIRASLGAHACFESHHLQDLFANLEQLVPYNQQMLAEMVEQGDQHVGQLFMQFAPFLKMFGMFVSNYSHAQEVLRELRSRPVSSAFISACELQPRCHGLSLDDYLIMPVQRVPRYKLLLTELQKHTRPNHRDKANLDRAVELVSGAADSINQELAKQESRTHLLRLQNSIDGCGELVTASRLFICEGDLTKMNRNGPKNYHFFLFSDMLMYATVKQKETKKHGPRYTTQSSHMFNLAQTTCLAANENAESWAMVLACFGQDVKIKPQQLERLRDCAFLIAAPTRSFIIMTETTEVRAQWVKDLQRCIDQLHDANTSRKQAGCRGEDIEDDEPQHLAPLMVQNSDVHQCTACHKKFGILTHRHHCHNCGLVVCSKCSSSKAVLEFGGNEHAQRVCDSCARSLSSSAYTALQCE